MARTLDRKLLAMTKRSFMSAEQLGGGGGDPAAGGMPPGGDPSMGGMPPEGMPMDPAMMGGDPSMGGGMPPPGLDPAMAGMMGGGMPSPPPAPPAGAQITLSLDELIKLIKLFRGDPAAEKVAEPAPAASPDPGQVAQLLAQLQGG